MRVTDIVDLGRRLTGAVLGIRPRDEAPTDDELAAARLADDVLVASQPAPPEEETIA